MLSSHPTCSIGTHPTQCTVPRLLAMQLLYSASDATNTIVTCQARSEGVEREGSRCSDLYLETRGGHGSGMALADLAPRATAGEVRRPACDSTNLLLRS